MIGRFLRPALLSALLFSLAACATGHVRSGDRLAKRGKWEEALAEYRTAGKDAPTNRVLKRISNAERRVAELYVKRGKEAAAAGQYAEAADWWKQAVKLRPADSRPGGARVVIAENAPRLETCGERSVEARKWEEAFRCYEALQVVYPDRLDLSEKIDDAHRSFAAELDRDAQGLAKKGLTGAALVAEMRARFHDPLHPTAFERESAYRKQLATASLVNVPAVALDDRGFWGLGAYLVPALTQRLGEFPPYGPTKVPQVQAAVFAVTVEDFGWWDESVHGLARKEIAGAKPSGKEKVPNPEHAAQRTLTDRLEKELKEMEAAAGKTAALEEPKAPPAPTPPTEGRKAKGSKKEPPKTDERIARKIPPPRAPSAEQLESKRAQLEEARQRLAGLPETVDPAGAAAATYVAWTEVTRIVEARVRFDVREPDFAEPVSKTITLRVDRKDRTHAGNESAGEAPDLLDLPPVEELVRELARIFGPPGTGVLRAARERRADRWIERGREARDKGAEDEAVDMYVRALFARGAEAGSLPGDVATVMAMRLESGRFRDIVEGP